MRVRGRAFVRIVCSLWVFSQAAVLGTAIAADTWPQFRGPSGQGHADGPAPVKWSEGENIVWKTPVAGKGWSTPVIYGNQIWLTTGMATNASEEEKKQRLATNTGSQPLNVVNDLVVRAICLDRETGNVLHDIVLLTASEPEPIHTLNSFASPSPIIEAGRLYCHFGPNGTACVDTDSASVLWTNQSDELRVKTENGAGSTPVLWNDLLIAHFDGSDTQFIAALDKHTGRVVWKTPRSGKMHDNPQMKKSYGTPLLVQVGDQAVLMSPAADWLYAYDPETGAELWKLPYETLGFSVVPKPVARQGVLYFCTSFMRSQLLAVRFADEGSLVEPEIIWRYKSQVSQMPSPILVDGLLYFVADTGGIVTCVDANGGQMVWRERLGGNFSASPIYAGGRIYFFDRAGKTHVIKPGRQFDRVATNTLDGSIMASPAVVNDGMYVRTDKAVYRIHHESGSGFEAIGITE